MQLSGPSAGSTTTDSYGFYDFYGLEGGTYSVQILGVTCVRKNPRTVTVGWGEYAYVVFEADTACAGGAPPRTSNGFDPVVAALLSIDEQPAARAAPAPR